MKLTKHWYRCASQEHDTLDVLAADPRAAAEDYAWCLADEGRLADETPVVVTVRHVNGGPVSRWTASIRTLRIAKAEPGGEGSEWAPGGSHG